jgi:hypothetical protein
MYKKFLEGSFLHHNFDVSDQAFLHDDDKEGGKGIPLEYSYGG